jgi:hypothetical protein
MTVRKLLTIGIKEIVRTTIMDNVTVLRFSLHKSSFLPY